MARNALRAYQRVFHWAIPRVERNRRWILCGAWTALLLLCEQRARRHQREAELAWAAGVHRQRHAAAPHRRDNGWILEPDEVVVGVGATAPEEQWSGAAELWQWARGWSAPCSGAAELRMLSHVAYFSARASASCWSGVQGPEYLFVSHAAWSQQEARSEQLRWALEGAGIGLLALFAAGMRRKVSTGPPESLNRDPTAEDRDLTILPEIMAALSESAGFPSGGRGFAVWTEEGALVYADPSWRRSFQVGERGGAHRDALPDGPLLRRLERDLRGSWVQVPLQSGLTVPVWGLSLSQRHFCFVGRADGDDAPQEMANDLDRCCGVIDAWCRQRISPFPVAMLQALNLDLFLLRQRIGELAVNATAHEPIPHHLAWSELGTQMALAFKETAIQAQCHLSWEASRDLSGPCPKEDVEPVLHELLQNAIRAAAAGGHVHFGMSGCGDWILSEISDSGPGIPFGERAQVFQRFHSAWSQGKPCLGLGLNIVKHGVERAGARLEVYSGPRGTTFRLFWPVTALPDEAGIYWLDGALA